MGEKKIELKCLTCRFWKKTSITHKTNQAICTTSSSASIREYTNKENWCIEHQVKTD